MNHFLKQFLTGFSLSLYALSNYASELSTLVEIQGGTYDDESPDIVQGRVQIAF